MGVRGLMSFVEDHSHELFADVKLRNTKIVIDGYSLFYRLCFNSNLELRYGGEYDSFADVVQDFFESLSACNICPYVVLDGGCDLSDKKLATLMDRIREKVQVAHSLSMGRGGCVCPLLTREVFIQVLIKLGVPFMQCFSEADRDIMTLANHWNCPVLSSDSDFCISDLKTGFLPLSSFQWTNMHTIKGTQDYYIPARWFSVNKFCSRFGVDKGLLPLFAVLSGNDHVNLPVLDSCFGKVRFPPASPNGKKHQRIVELLKWLSQFTSPSAALETVLKSLPRKDRGPMRDLLCSSMDEYQPSPVQLQDFFQHGTYACPDAQNLGLPDWVLRALARGQLAPFVCDALVLRRTFLQPQVENTQRPNAHKISQPIRQAIYGLLSGTPRGSLPPQPVVCIEVGRISRNIKTSLVEAAVPPIEYCDLSRLAELPVERRRGLLLETLKVKQSLLEPVPALLQLPVAVTCYWLQHPEVKAQLQHLQALLLALLLGPLQAALDSPGTSALPEEGAKKLYAELRSMKARAWPGEKLDLDVAHALCQWQCCLQMGLYLNQLLSTPLSEPDLTRLYSGRLVHNLCRQLLLSASLEALLRTCPEAKRLYEHLFSATRSYAPAELFLPKSKQNSKKKRPKKQGTRRPKNRAGAASDLQSAYRGSNRFRLLMAGSLEDYMETIELE
ncbi:protein asteroid homolog 1 [Sorex araneus]|uniref:protein asteroid homolog 1 n=1 Tax=Sorex araneus TaxID=42254 RepID=UPI0024337C22|nr:protein asteroid homolog 1 [Sorex araneus]XP_054991871.1 protein asteroid homolog 1 [Sorex araneus]XP_054991873.1 protein asteroid homolog 1 [Sorex araneus]